MLIGFIATKNTWEYELEAIFGRATAFVVLDTETNSLSLFNNTKNADLGHGAGIQTAQSLVQAKVDAVISLRVGPKAFKVLQEANVPVYYAESGSTIQSA